MRELLLFTLVAVLIGTGCTRREGGLDSPGTTTKSVPLNPPHAKDKATETPAPNPSH